MSKRLDITTSKLANGFQIVKVNLPHFHSLTTFLAIRSGSRYETADNNGIAHFLEHMVFKGTKSYPKPIDLAKAIEGIGGYFNAWTANDHTAYWNIVPSEHYKIGAEVVFEQAYQALLRSEDLERERGVILEEIKRTQDDPATYVDDLSGGLLFAGHQLGQSILGPSENIKKMSIQAFIDYRAQHYLPSQSLLIVVGNLADKPYEKMVEEYTKDLTAQELTLPHPFTGASSKALKVVNKPTDQTHFMLGMATPKLALNHDELYIGEVVNAVLGRGMSSRLFLNVREQKGLAYSVHSHVSTFEDTGCVTVYGGVNTEKIDLALSAVAEELDRLTSELVEEGELEKAKMLVRGSYDLSLDRPIDIARHYGVDRLLGGTYDFESAKEKVASVTAEQVRDFAQAVFAPDYRTLAVIGPYPSDERFKKFLKL